MNDSNLKASVQGISEVFEGPRWPEVMTIKGSTLQPCVSIYFILRTKDRCLGGPASRGTPSMRRMSRQSLAGQVEGGPVGTMAKKKPAWDCAQWGCPWYVTSWSKIEIENL